QGVKYQSSNATVLQNMTGSTGAAFNDPTKGSELAKSQFSKGSDVVFAAAGGTGIGVYQAAKDEGKLAIGVDSNQNHVQPGTMLTSMVKRVDQAAYKTYKDAAAGTWKPGLVVLGLSDGGVDWALDDNNASLITADMKAKMKDIRAKIISGEIKVHDYMSDNTCNY
ncbi:MAG: BMP family ABC transporter substrate-binding protein, partial [Gammaproteobacteria bacterium]|nr:BMP family ABC transporter substrate-binding protein [Gammaproteobacteria bacterium]